MSWKLVKMEDRFVRDDRPFISISNDRIAFSAIFARIAELDDGNRVFIFVDEESFRIGFEFHKNERLHSLALVSDNRTKTKKRSRFFCSSHGLVKQYAWINSITKLPSRNRRFYPKKESNKWFIALYPSFDQRYARESGNIPTDAVGIYRYMRENGEIVYIGRGNIRKRLIAPERADWDFDVIEYSIVKDPDQQVRWEAFWIDKFKDMNGCLPFYNKVAGHTSDGLESDSKSVTNEG
jgi:hypothetical protein